LVPRPAHSDRWTNLFPPRRAIADVERFARTLPSRAFRYRSGRRGTRGWPASATFHEGSAARAGASRCHGRFRAGAPRRSHANRTSTLWIATDFVNFETARSMAPGSISSGFPTDLLLVAHGGAPFDALFAMEGGLSVARSRTVCRNSPRRRPDRDTAAALAARYVAASVCCSVPGDAISERRALRAGRSRPRQACRMSSRACHTAFTLSLTRNRRGSVRPWTLIWDHHNTPSRRYLSVWMVRRFRPTGAAKHDTHREAPLSHTVSRRVAGSRVNDAAARGLAVGMPLADARRATRISRPRSR